VIDMGVSRDAYGIEHRLPESKIGLWSDDTSLTLCLAESLARGYDLKDMAERFCAWYYDGYLSARDHAFDIGRQTGIAIPRLRAILAGGVTDKLSRLGGEQSEEANGNGALMRILPLIAYIYHKETGEQLRITGEVASLTHPHIRSTLCCLWYLKYAEKLIDGEDKHEAVTATQREITAMLGRTSCSGRDRRELRLLLEGELSRGETDPARRDEPDYIHSDGYVVHTLEAAMWCLLNHSNYRDTVLAAVNLGDDTDTVAAVAGGLAGILYSYEGIPENWIRNLKKPDVFERIAGLYHEPRG
jgi:ADP-ribosylglycohydrolase